jgi:hypothetical protein
MQKIQISFNATKLDKELLNNGYVSLDIIPLKEPKQKTNKEGNLIQGDGWKLMQTHFVVQSNRNNKDIKMPIIGDGCVFEKVETKEPEVAYPEDDINPSDIPF